MLQLRPTTEADLDFVLQAESDAENSPYIGQWSRQRHRDAVAAPHMAHLMADAGRPVGYLILQGLPDENDSTLIQRLVITEKGQGFGRAALQQVQRLAFDTYGTHRLWLDVKTFNHRARGLYESVGFRCEGCLQDVYKCARGYESVFIMAQLRPDYVAR